MWVPIARYSTVTNSTYQLLMRRMAEVGSRIAQRTSQWRTCRRSVRSSNASSRASGVRSSLFCTSCGTPSTAFSSSATCRPQISEAATFITAEVNELRTLRRAAIGTAESETRQNRAFASRLRGGRHLVQDYVALLIIKRLRDTRHQIYHRLPAGRSCLLICIFQVERLTECL